MGEDGANRRVSLRLFIRAPPRSGVELLLGSLEAHSLQRFSSSSSHSSRAPTEMSGTYLALLLKQELAL